MKKLILFLLLTSLSSFGQETNSSAVKAKYRITVDSGEMIPVKKYRIQEQSGLVDILTEDGKSLRFKLKNVLSIREIIIGWNYFDWNEEGFTDYSTVKIDSINRADLYKLVKNWVKDTYNTPSEVIKSEIENSKIRIEGISSNLITQKVLGSTFAYDGTYSIEISVRDGKYKFDPIMLKYYSPPSQYSAGGYINIPINAETLSSYYTQKGSKKGQLKKMWRTIPSNVESLFNDLNLSLFHYINDNRKGGVIDSEEW